MSNKINLLVNGNSFNLDINTITKWQEFEQAYYIKQVAYNEVKRSILKNIIRYKSLVNELLQVADPKQELDKIPTVDLSNTGLSRSVQAFKIQ